MSDQSTPDPSPPPGSDRSAVRDPVESVAAPQELQSRSAVPRRTPTLSADLLTRALQGQQVSHVTMSDAQQSVRSSSGRATPVARANSRLVIHFANGATLAVDPDSVEVDVAPKGRRAPAPTQDARQPTRRQFEYLAFIARYIERFGRASAESDIERHFLVSAPSVNQMMQTLERLGFIARQRGVPRSIRIRIELPQHVPRR